MKAYKLFRKRPNGTLGSLFANRGKVLEVGKLYQAEEHRTKGLAFRPFWHSTSKPIAPHLKMRLANGERRVWCEVEITGVTEMDRPEIQGSKWYLSDTLTIIGEING